MTRSTSARVAGAAYLLYIGVAFPAMSIGARMMRGDTAAAKLATLAGNVGLARAEIILSLAAGLCAFALAISLHAFTRDEDRDIARLGMLCRFGEGLIAFPVTTLTMLWLLDGGSAALGDQSHVLVLWLAKLAGWQQTYGAYLFALGSTAFCFLLLRGRMIPTWLGWVGLIGSAILVVALPMRFIGAIQRPYSDIVWIPIAVFEIVVAVWFLWTGGERKAA
jgi:hypothetical protein